MRTVLLVLVALTLGGATAGLAACGDNNKLFSSNEASGLKSDIGEVSAAVRDQNCNAAADAALTARQHLAGAPSVPDDVRNVLDEKLRQLSSVAETECKKTTDTSTQDTTQSETATTQSETLTTNTQPTNTQPTPTQPTTPTATTPPVPTVPPVVPPPNNGGIGPGNGKNGPGQ